MAKAEIPDWFDLKFYQEPLSCKQWLSRIASRGAYLEYKPLFRDLTEQEDMFHFFVKYDLGDFDLSDNFIDPLPVKSVSAADLALSSVCWGAEALVHGAAISVNLNHDDEAIKQAFSVWLAGQRREMSERFSKPVNDDDFQKWQKYKVLAAFDLCQWAEIKGFRYTNKQLANALFPPESIEFDERDVDMTERVRKLVRPLGSR